MSNIPDEIRIQVMEHYLDITPMIHPADWPPRDLITADEVLWRLKDWVEDAQQYRDALADEEMDQLAAIAHSSFGKLLPDVDLHGESEFGYE